MGGGAGQRLPGVGWRGGGGMRAGERVNAWRAGMIGLDAEMATAMMHTTAAGGLMTGATRTTTTTKAHVQGTTTLGPYTEGNDKLKR